MNITINVTQEDIKKGKRGKCKLCPIALATRSMFGLNIQVSNLYVWVHHLHFWLKQTEVEWIKSFDKGRKVKPFSFQLENVPKELIKYCED